jgi:putative transposase
VAAALLGEAVDHREAKSRALSAELASAALTMAIQQRKPKPGLIHHSDRGVQHAAADYRKMMIDVGMTPSMSRKANCHDNAPMESFFHTSRLNSSTIATTRLEPRRNDIFAFIEGFYNRTRLHSAIGYISPGKIKIELSRYSRGQAQARSVAALRPCG